MTSVLPPSAAAEWKLHWKLVLAAAIGFSFHSVAGYSIGLFMEPLNQEFGWSRAHISAGLTISALVSIPLSPLVGAMIDRWGARRLAIPGLILKALSFVVLATATGSELQWYALWVFYSVVALGVKSTVWTAAISGVFSAGRGLALAATLSGTAIAQILAPPLTQWLIDAFGWRASFVWLGVGWGTPALLICLFGLFDVHDTRRKAGESASDAPPLPGLTVHQALRSAPLWRIAAATLIIMVLAIGTIVHLVPILTDTGLNRQRAAFLASLAGVAGIVGKLVTGYLMDRMSASWVGGLTMAVMAVAYLMLIEPFKTPVLIIVAMVIIGYSAGCIMQICAYLTSRYAGMRNFGKVFGVMASIFALGAGIGPLIAGMVYDAFGTYTPLLTASIVGSLVGGGLLIGLGPYPQWEAQVAEPANA